MIRQFPPRIVILSGADGSRQRNICGVEEPAPSEAEGTPYAPGSRWTQQGVRMMRHRFVMETP
jgi:hypothetical protein